MFYTCGYPRSACPVLAPFEIDVLIKDESGVGGPKLEVGRVLGFLNRFGSTEMARVVTPFVQLRSLRSLFDTW